MFQLRRDEKGKRTNFLSKKFTDKVMSALEAVMNLQVWPAGAGELVGDENGLILKINATAAATVNCPLGLYDASSGGFTVVGVRWGTIVGRQPAGFFAGGDPAYTVPVAGFGYVYAWASANVESQQWVAAGIAFSTDPFKSNDSATAWQLLGSYSVSGGKLNVSSTCGNVDFAFCDLVPADSSGNSDGGGGDSSGGDSGGGLTSGGLDGSGGLTTGGLTTGGLTTGGLTTGGLTTGGLTTGGL